MWRWMIGLIGLALIGVGAFKYNEYLNQQIQIVEEEILIHDLPEAFDEFKILQITDLHGFLFGENQEEPINLINSLDYDVLAFTGDLGDLYDDPNGSAMQVLIEGINKEKPMVYVEGNHGPFVIDQVAGKKTEIAYWLENHRVNLLFEPMLIERSGQRLWIAHQSEPFYRASGLEDVLEEDLLIRIMHYPMNEAFYNNRSENNDFPPYDLILAGHYHGGQWWIPFYGAFFVSDVNGHGWFPSQNCVSGLTEWSVYYQYVSRGLGASGKYKWLKQRWFNPPEVNLLTLKSEEK